MCYKNGKDIIPYELLIELQKYVQGELVYIPKCDEKRAAWGELNGTRIAIKERNMMIYKAYKEGFSVEELMEEYHLSQDSIRKIIMRINKCSV